MNCHNFFNSFSRGRTYTGLKGCYGSLPYLPNKKPDPRTQTRFFTDPFFPSEVTLRVFLYHFVFPFKNKTKISGDSKSFSKNQIFTKQNKKRVSPSSEKHMSQNAGSTVFYSNIL